ncbi:1-deoxy-D-xylulose-5-phosphate reductoisomerase [Corynebacterium gerontici]|uniref:1-deoxy-D-xylulose 5-phosphate reductoisomerase n=1 Tax=Corynebacterium gerontici TaxID=2079234 RepID=A0A3G6J1U3_9CORY|nr:1-deoxy-D-xylulose-5-phosphate reductoisomerase [Corynebacterium gerontici]AZA11673.1 1-deoxy-D-xylulose 5-phosphate reductoisomerase [Corynebacterium gerontici]
MRTVTQRILILGSTGSIGTQALEVIADHRDRFEVVGLAAGSNAELIAQQAKLFDVPASHIAIADERAAAQLRRELGGAVLSGQDSAARLVREVEADTVLNALVGSMGLDATMATIEAGEILALANKESLVAGGELVMAAAKPGQIVPVDSEHTAMAQSLRAGFREEVSRFVLTASGGPFRGWSREEMWEVTPEQAAQHPTWSMGQMNTLNSATLVNKGLELIEATLLFDVAAEDIDVVVHPQSIVHSMITFCDGATIAQASPPSMKMPIAHALAWPHRVADVQPHLDFSQASTWEFLPVEPQFKAIDLAREAASAGGTFSAVYNASNEQAAEAFLQGRIRFPQIVDAVEEVLQKANDFAGHAGSIEEVLEHERLARERADVVVEKLARLS